MCDMSDRLIFTKSNVEKMAHDPVVVDINMAGRHPGAGLMLANFFHYNNTQRAVYTLSTFMLCSIT